MPCNTGAEALPRVNHVNHVSQILTRARSPVTSKYPDKSFSVFEDLRGFGNLAGLMSDSYLRIYVRVLNIRNRFGKNKNLAASSARIVVKKGIKGMFFSLAASSARIMVKKGIKGGRSGCSLSNRDFGQMRSEKSFS